MLSKKISRRTFLASTAVATMGAALAACAPTTAPVEVGEVAAPVNGEPAVAAPKEPVTVRFMTRSGADYIPSYERIIAEEFESRNENIKVSLEPAPDGWTDLLLTQMVAGTAVDLFEAWGNIFFNWTERDLLLDCQPFVDRDMTREEIEDYNDFQWEGLMMKGVRVGMPKYINVMTLTVNVDLWEKYGVPIPPEDGDYDHDDYTEWMAALTENARAAGDNDVWAGWLPAWSWDRFWNHIHMFDGKVVNELYGTEYMLDKPEAQDALQWMYDMSFTWNYHAQPAQVENRWYRAAFNPGLIMTAESGTYPGTNDQEFMDAGIRYDYRHVPKGPTGKRSVLGTTDAWSITKQTKHPEESWKLLHFLSGPVFQMEAIIKAEGRIPVLKSQTEIYFDILRDERPNLRNVRLETISEMFEWGYAEDTPWFCNQIDAVDLIRPALEKVFMVGDVGPEYFIEIADEVNASQEGCVV